MGAWERIHTRCRVVVDNDFSGDPDGLIALAHHLLSPANRVDTVTCSLVNPMFGTHEGATERAATLVRGLVTVLGGVEPVVAAGHDHTFHPGSPPSPAAMAIVAVATVDDPVPLYVVCGGPLTNVAEALALDPGLASRFELVWIGGSLRNAAFEYNRDTDPDAARFVLGHDALTVHQFSLEAYRQCAFSIAELDELREISSLGEWLWERFQTPPDWIELGEVWPQGDSPPVLVTALTDESSDWVSVERPPGAAPWRACTRVDTRLLFTDFLAKLRRQEKP